MSSSSLTSKLDQGVQQLGRYASSAAGAVWSEAVSTYEGHAKVGEFSEKWSSSSSSFCGRSDFWMLSEAFSRLGPSDFQKALKLFQWLQKGSERGAVPVARGELIRMSHDPCFERWVDFCFAPDIGSSEKLAPGLKGPSVAWQYLCSYFGKHWDSLEDFFSFHKEAKVNYRLGSFVPAWMLTQARQLSAGQSKEELLIGQWKGVWRFVRVFARPSTAKQTFTVGILPGGAREERFSDELAVIPQKKKQQAPSAVQGASSSTPSLAGVRFPEGASYYQSVVLRIWAMQQACGHEEICKRILHHEVSSLFYPTEQIQRAELPQELPWDQMWNACFARESLAVPRGNRPLALCLFYAFLSLKENYRSLAGYQRFLSYHRGDLKLAFPIPGALAPHWVLVKTQFSSTSPFKEGDWAIWIHPEGGTARYGRVESVDGDKVCLRILEAHMGDSLRGTYPMKPETRAFARGSIGYFSLA